MPQFPQTFKFKTKQNKKNFCFYFLKQLFFLFCNSGKSKVAKNKEITSIAEYFQQLAQV